jgi:hypothetical protein
MRIGSGYLDSACKLAVRLRQRRIEVTVEGI